jgi:hypothetical protein
MQHWRIKRGANNLMNVKGFLLHAGTRKSSMRFHLIGVGACILSFAHALRAHFVEQIWNIAVRDAILGIT